MADSLHEVDGAGSRLCCYGSVHPAKALRSGRTPQAIDVRDRKAMLANLTNPVWGEV